MVLALVATAAAWTAAAGAWAATVAAPLPAGLVAGEPGRVASVIDGDTLLFEDGREVRLVGIQAPKLPLGRAGFRSWPLAPEAKAALEALALGKRLTPHFGGARADRHGRVLAHLADDAGGWAQGALLALGLARVYSFEDNRTAITEMLAIEREARAAERGIWAHPYYRVLGHAEAGRHIGTFQLVEGRVLEASVVRGRAYLNFGADWRTDFTIAVPERALATFRTAFGRGLERLTGTRVRVRGWLRSLNGPLIEATHPEQIEVLEP